VANGLETAPAGDSGNTIDLPRRIRAHRIEVRVKAISDTAPALPSAGGHHTVGLATVVGALGVVFGDIGTSPLYTIQTVFSPSDPHPVPIAKDNVYGVVSLIFWSVMLIVTLTYITFIMRCDNNGEGGIMALITLLRRLGGARGRRAALALAALGIFGAAMFLGDSMITPAISVLSAVEGLNAIDPAFEEWVVPITAVITWSSMRTNLPGSSSFGGT